MIYDKTIKANPIMRISSSLPFFIHPASTCSRNSISSISILLLLSFYFDLEVLATTRFFSLSSPNTMLSSVMTSAGVGAFVISPCRKARSLLHRHVTLINAGCNNRNELFRVIIPSSHVTGGVMGSSSGCWMSSRAGDTPKDTDDVEDDDEEEQLLVVEPAMMKTSEIKAELDLREVDYSDCFDKEALADRLRSARATGKANPRIIDQFNKQKIEDIYMDRKVELSDERIRLAVANDGTLPGGLTPDQFNKLVSNPEIMTLLQCTKMQEAMRLMMTDGREGLENKLVDDPELLETVSKLDSLLKAIQ